MKTYILESFYASVNVFHHS